MSYSDQLTRPLTARSKSYITNLGLAAAVLAAFAVFGFDATVDWIGLSKGGSFFWAGMLILLNAILFVGFVVDLAVYFILKYF